MESSSPEGSPLALRGLIAMSPLLPSSPMSPPFDDDLPLPPLLLPLSETESTAAGRHSKPTESSIAPQQPKTPDHQVTNLPAGEPPIFPLSINTEPRTPETTHHVPEADLESNGPVWTLPIRGKGEAKKQNTRRKGQKQHKKTIEEQCTRSAAPSWSAAQASTSGQQHHDISSHHIFRADPDPFPLGEDPEQHRSRLEETLEYLQRNGLTWGDLVLYISDPASKKGAERFTGMFDVPGRVEQVLTYWTSSRNSRTARKSIDQWVMSYITRRITYEGQKATQSGILQLRKMSIDEAFALNFSLTKLYDHLMRLCPTMTTLLREFSMTTWQKNARTDMSMRRNDQVCQTIYIAKFPGF